MKQITLEKLEIYQEYGGDIDGFARTASLKDMKLISSNDWMIIEELIQNLVLVKQNLASAEFTKKIMKKLELVADEEVIRILTK